MNRVAVRAACAAALAIGVFFIFVWAPQPWGWEGFDDYHDLGRAVARGDAYPTIDRPWGYAYYLAAFYRAFGDRPVVPIVGQAILNACLPLLVYAFARVEFDERVGVTAALLTGVLSFNTVYASTQASDSVCTVIFIAAVVAFARARRGGNWRLFALAGILLGIAAQFRPNLILVAPLLAVFLLAERPDRGGVRHAALLVALAAAMLVPWTVRTYRLTGTILPTTTHGALQLWYGTLQSGPYLKSRAHNPRSAFEKGTFPYTSLDRVPLIVTGHLGDCGARPSAIDVAYWTDRDPTRRSIAARIAESNDFSAEVPPSPAPTAYYFSVDADGRPVDPVPLVFFISADHLGDIDRHGDLLDIFDVIRLLRHLAWGEPLPYRERLDLDGDGRIDEGDAQRAVTTLIADARQPRAAIVQAHVQATPDSVTLAMSDGSALTVPRAWTGRITDVGVTGEAAERLLHATVPFAALIHSSPERDAATGCRPVRDVAVNAPYYREEMQAMRRLTALAFDNIRRDPAAFAAASAYRTLRVFFVEGSDDPHTTQQFTGGGRIYRLAYGASIALLAVCAAGVWAAWRRGAAIALPLLLIAYIPATLAFVLTNMRYSITVQPLMFMFVASALVSGAEAIGIVEPMPMQRRTDRRDHESGRRASSP
jgi:dolichyl-phosphate-mannose-protein mannosyltransferase